MTKRLIVDELVPVYETDKGERVVDGRELHEFLEVGRDFTTWMRERIEKYGFVDGEDFAFTLTKTGERQNVTRHDFFLKLDTAKELCMVENNEQGSKARKYFIEVEKRFRQQQMDISKLTPEMQMFHHMFESVAKTQLELADTQKQLTDVKESVQVMQETFLQRDPDWRASINSMFNGAVFRSGAEHSEMRRKSYEILEERGHCDLNKRLRNLKARLEDSGATKTQINETNKMDVIESDPKLKEIYSTVVKELSIGSMRVMAR